MIEPSFLLAATVLAVSTGGTATRTVGLICVGDEPARVGYFQRVIEERLSQLPGIVVVPTEKLVDLLAPTVAEGESAVAPAVRDEAERLHHEATEAFFANRLALALDRFAAHATVLDGHDGFTLAERVRVRLWRATVFLLLDDRSQAEREVIEALVLDPALKVDLTEFRRSVQSLVEELRPRLPPVVSISVTDAPSDARFSVDGGETALPLRLVPGRHRLVVSSRGRRSVSQTVEATADASLSIPLPIAVDAEVEGALTSLVWQGRPSAGHAAALADLAGLLDVEWLLVVAERGGMEAGSRAILISTARGGRYVASSVYPTTVEAADRMATWAMAKLRTAPKGSPATVVAAPESPAASMPSAIPTPPTDPTRPTWSRWEIDGRISVVSGLRSRTIASSGTSFDSGFSVGGTTLAVGARRSVFFLSLEALLASGGLSTLDVRLPDGTRSRVNGGATLRGRAVGGLRWKIRHSDGAPRFAILNASIQSERHRSEDVRDDDGAALRLLPSHRRTDAVISVGLSQDWHLGSRAQETSLELGTTVWGTLDEDPPNASGHDGGSAAGRAFLFRATHGCAGSERLDVTAGYTGTVRRVQRTGPARNPFAFESAVLRESEHLLTAGVRVRF